MTIISCSVGLTMPQICYKYIFLKIDLGVIVYHTWWVCVFGNINLSIRLLPRYLFSSLPQRKGNASISIQFSIKFCGLGYFTRPLSPCSGDPQISKSQQSPGSLTLRIASQILARLSCACLGLCKKNCS